LAFILNKKAQTHLQCYNRNKNALNIGEIAMPLLESTATATTLATPTSQTLIWKYMGSVGLWSVLIIGGLVAFLWLLKTKPEVVQIIRSWVGMGHPPSQEDESKLKIEETLELDENKQLMIIQCEHERFLVSSGTDGLRFLTKLDPSQAYVEALQDAYDAEKTTHEDAAGTRGMAITPTDTGYNSASTQAGVTAPTSPRSGTFLQGVRSLFPLTQGTPQSWGTPSSSSHPPFGLK